ncbi:MAG: histidine kinase [Bacteroidota bacterium]
MFDIKWRYLYVFLLGSYSFLNIKFTQGDTILSFPISDLVLYAIILVIVLVVWEGNHLIEKIHGKRRARKVSHRLVRHFFLSAILVALTAPSFSLVINYFLASDIAFNGFNQLLGFSFRINLFLQCINAIIVYNKELSTARLEAETLKTETSEAQFEALRKQINPHFLFNSFNVLSSVIETDQNLAVQFVEQLSKVYRYLLRTQDMKTIPLEEELDFIESYIFLLKIRFGNNLQFERNITDLKDKIPPSTLQLLIENAIKHNEVSKKNPLKVTMERRNGNLFIKNNRNPKIKPVVSEMVGLANIRKRYQLLGAIPPEIKDTKQEFSIKLSLIK